MTRSENANVKHRSRVLRLSAIFALGISPALNAQSLNYGAARELFGEPVTTSVTGSPQRASDVPAGIEIVTADDIRRSGAYDIPGILRHLVGVDVLQWTNDYADVSVRGYNQAGSARLLVLIDGRQVYADYYGFTPWSALPVEIGAIRQIEVVKGPNSALFGFNAVGGVVNIVTVNPLHDDVSSASLSVGTQGLTQGALVKTFRLGDRAGFRVELGGRASNDFSTPARDLLSNVRRGDNRGSVNLNGIFQVTDDVQFGIEATHSEADETEIAPVLVPFYVRYGTDSVKGQIDADTSAGLLRATAYSNWIKAGYSYNNEFAPSPTSPIFNNQTIVTELEDIVKLGADHTLRASLEYRHNTESTAPVGGGHVSYDVMAVSGMWEWKIAPTVTLTNALRVDRLTLGRDGYTPPGYPFSNADWNRTVTEESFNSGLVWRVGDEDTLRFTIGRGVELPNLVDFGAFVANNTAGNFTGVPTLQPTIVTNYEVGWDHALPSLGANLHASVYHQTTAEIASIVGDLLFKNGQVYLASENIGSSRADGIELSLKGDFLESWHWGVGYSAEIVTDRFDPTPTPGLTQTDFQHTMPVHVVTANLGWAHGPWEVDGFLKYESAFYGLTPASLTEIPSLVPIADYVSIDGRIAYKLTDRVTLSLSGQNISQSTQHQTSSAGVERRVIGGISVDF